MTSALYAGIDVGSKELVVAIASDKTPNDQWRRLGTKTFANTFKGIAELTRYLVTLPEPLACVCAEATGPYSLRLARDMAAAAPKLPGLAIVNPAWIKGTVRSLGLREKTDALDASAIAMHAKFHQPPSTRLRSEHEDELRELFCLRGEVVEEITAHKNRLHAARTDVVRQHLQALIEDLDIHRQAIEDKVQRCVAADEQMALDYKLLRSIKGIGKVLAIAILAEIGDLRCFKREQLASYVGLFPASYQSGTSVHGRPHMIKGGCWRLRRTLYMATVCWVGRGAGKDTYQALLARGKTKMCSLGAHMRKLLQLARAVVVSGKPFDEEEYRRRQSALCA